MGGGWLRFHRPILTAHRAAVRLFALNSICDVLPDDCLCVIEGLGVGAVKGCGGVRVPDDDIECASRGRPFVCVELNLLRLARGDFACY